MTIVDGTETRLTIYVNDGDNSGHTALFSEIVHRAHHHGLAGASVLHGIVTLEPVEVVRYTGAGTTTP